jgi:hypothetical protein
MGVQVMPKALVDGVYVDITDEEAAAAQYAPVEAEEAAQRIRRDILLAQTDWWASSDRTMTQAEIDYRQALRDVPAQAGFPENVTWPTKP